MTEDLEALEALSEDTGAETTEPVAETPAVEGSVAPAEPAESPERSESAEKTVAFVVASIVDQPDLVKVSTDNSHATTRINVEVGPGDMGRVIGKRGRVANAIRAVGRAAAAKDGVNVDVEFVD